MLSISSRIPMNQGKKQMNAANSRISKEVLVIGLRCEKGTKYDEPRWVGVWSKPRQS
ncbi:hypothetical protein A33Q_4045 [Indibacter alkaliphilus LW1]|uniref:Uncharacterized protein n=1 Tax=Indibacter alkaliphilus (strain CCUG 57479 / KCTC 22604 / LW1) TaxID=1189612 RepID=S2CXQ5_INDAL|nr:hypothetical protein A33Q_4045 [Indibacter alkaliphilus LW1]